MRSVQSIRIFLTALICTTLMACASGGNMALKDETKESVAQKLTVGMTQDEVKAIYGEPSNVTFTDSGSEVYTYMFTRARAKATSFIPIYGALAGGSNATQNTLTILFGEDNRLKKHTFSSSEQEMNTGVLNQ